MLQLFQSHNKANLFKDLQRIFKELSVLFLDGKLLETQIVLESWLYGYGVYSSSLIQFHSVVSFLS